MTTADTASPSTFKLGGEIEICRIGLGTNRIQNDAASRAILPAALELGVNLIDTADIYTGGVSERVIGETVASDPRALIATKGGYHGAAPERIAAAIDASRSRLGLETIDLYYLHRPDPDFPIEQSIDPILSAKQDGRVHHIGLSNVTLDQLDRVRSLAPVAAVQNRYNLDNSDQDDVIDYCERHAIMFVPYFPLRGSERAKKIAERLGADRNQVVLAAMLARSPVVVPIPGTRNPQHLQSNLGATRLTLTSDDLEALSLASKS
ncbi:MAG: aldo/keto reductase [Thermoleophilaceae bacterium]|nr:aldo/keto reductase [Thermoleophilaceae bacterium]